MSAALDHAFNNDDSRLARVLNKAAHLMLYGIAVIAALDVMRWVLPTRWGPAWIVLALVGAVTNVLLVIGLLHTTLARLCVRCMQEVPADAPLRAQRRHRWLWLSHLPRNRRQFAVLAAVLVIWPVVKAYWHLPNIAYLPTDVAVVGYLYAGWLHHRLRPWCPYCRDWGSGGIQEPSPDPVQKATL